MPFANCLHKKGHYYENVCNVTTNLRNKRSHAAIQRESFPTTFRMLFMKFFTLKRLLTFELTHCLNIRVKDHLQYSRSVKRTLRLFNWQSIHPCLITIKSLHQSHQHDWLTFKILKKYFNTHRNSVQKSRARAKQLTWHNILSLVWWLIAMTGDWWLSHTHHVILPWQFPPSDKRSSFVNYYFRLIIQTDRRGCHWKEKKWVLWDTEWQQEACGYQSVSQQTAAKDKMEVNVIPWYLCT